MSKIAPQTLQAIAAGIREEEQQATATRKQRDRKLDEARQLARKASDHVIRAANLREILAGVDADFYAQRFGYVFDERADPERDELIAAYRDGLAFLEATPDLPFTNRYMHLTFSTDGTNDERRARVESAAQLMNVPVKQSNSFRGRPEVGVEREFGPVTLYGDVELDPEGDEAAQPTSPVAQDQVGEALDERMASTGGELSSGRNADGDGE